MKKGIIMTGSFLIILFLALWGWNSVFQFKYADGIYSVTKFYELPDNTIDVLILGSSHAYEDINTGMLWDEHGIASFILAGSLQPLWNTYYYLKEALKTQTPKLIVLEGFMTSSKEEFMEDNYIILNNFGLHRSSDKIESVKASVPRQRWKDFFLEYFQYHSRYNDIGRADFLKDRGDPFFTDWKGFACNMETIPNNNIDVTNISDRRMLSEKAEKYYRAILELAQEKNIPIIVIISPYAGITEKEQEIYNRAGDIASEYGVPFVNYNLSLQELGIDFSVDAAELSHLNYRGNRKFTSYFGNYIHDNFDLPDRRNDERYSSWQKNADFIRQMIFDKELSECSDLQTYVQKIQDPNLTVFVSIEGACTSSDETISRIVKDLGITDENAGGIWAVNNGKTILSIVNDEGYIYKTASTHDLILSRIYDESAGNYFNTIMIDKQTFSRFIDGINIVVYDNLTEKVVDHATLNADFNFSIRRYDELDNYFKFY